MFCVTTAPRPSWAVAPARTPIRATVPLARTARTEASRVPATSTTRSTPSAARDLARDLVPVGVRLVVDDVVRAHRADALELGVARRRREHAGAVHLREQEREQRDAARALDEHDVARLDAALRDDGVPRGDARRRAGSRPGPRRGGAAPGPRPPGSAPCTPAWRRPADRRGCRSSAPRGTGRSTRSGRRSGRRDRPTATRETPAPTADHAAGAVRAGDQGQLPAAPAVAAARHHVVPVIQGRGLHPEQHLARTRLGRRPLREPDAVRAPRVLDLHDLHASCCAPSSDGRASGSRH